MTIRQGCIHNKPQVLRENANNDPQGLSSLLGSFGGGGQQQGGGIGNLVGGLLGGDNNDNQDPSKQTKEKGGRIRRYVGWLVTPH